MTSRELAQQAELGHQRRNRSIDPEDSGAEAKGQKTSLSETCYFKINPASFWANGQNRPLAQHAFGRLGHGLLAIRMGEKSDRAIGEQFG